MADTKERGWLGYKLASDGPGPDPGDPTPLEIKAACRRIRAGWSTSEERYRRLRPHLEGERPGPMELTPIRMDSPSRDRRGDD